MNASCYATSNVIGPILLIYWIIAIGIFVLTLSAIVVAYGLVIYWHWTYTRDLRISESAK